MRPQRRKETKEDAKKRLIHECARIFTNLISGGTSFVSIRADSWTEFLLCVFLCFFAPLRSYVLFLSRRRIWGRFNCLLQESYV
jgi:hypothetical protein